MCVCVCVVGVGVGGGVYLVSCGSMNNQEVAITEKLATVEDTHLSCEYGLYKESYRQNHKKAGYCRIYSSLLFIKNTSA